MERENYFILLGLCFSPIESNNEKIEKIIKKKQDDWEFAKNNVPAKRDEAVKNLSMIDDMKRVMLSSELRSREAAEALSIKKQKMENVKRDLKKISLGGDPSDSIMKKLWREYAKYGFSLDEVKALLEEMRKPEDSRIIETISLADADKIQQSLEKLDLKGKNLYDFLHLTREAPVASLKTKAEQIAKETQLKAADPAKDGITGQLCNMCRRLFSTEKEKKKYDTYLDLMKYPELNETIDNAAKATKSISLETKLKLIEFGAEQYNASVPEISGYISDYCQFRGYELAADKSICGLCRAENHAGAEVCEKCGKPLFVICPSCNARNSNAAKECVKCKFEFDNIGKVSELLKNIRHLLSLNKYKDADKALSQVRQLWSRHPDIKELESQIRDKKDIHISMLRQIDMDIAERKYYAARIHIGETKNSGYEISQDIIDKVYYTIENVENEVKRSQNVSDEDAFAILIRQADIITDSDMVRQAIKRFPPKAPEQFHASINGKNVNLSWSATSSLGNIVYVVMRKTGGYSGTISDGEQIYQGNSLFCSDDSIESKVLYYYTLFVIRAGISSSGRCLEKEVVSVENVKNVKLISGDGSLDLSWEYDRELEEIEIGICQSEFKPESADLFHSLDTLRRDGVHISNLKNGLPYWIMIRAGYRVAGKLHYADEDMIKGIPERPAVPLTEFNIKHIERNLYHATWKDAMWSVVLFASDRKPEVNEGVVYDIEEFAVGYKRITYTKPVGDNAEFRLDFVGECYIIPAQVHAENVVVNTPVILTNIPMVENLTLEFNTARTEMYADFKWPKLIQHTLFVYRNDQYPTGPEDELAKRIFCSKEQYDNNAGILVSNPDEGMYYGIVYAYVDNGEKKIYSEGAMVTVNNEPQRLVYFSFSYKKSLFSRKASFEVTIRSDGDFVFPKFLMVAKKDSRPLRKTDGYIICTSDKEVMANKSYTYKYEVDEIKKGTVIQMFFVNDTDYARYKIQNEGNNTI